MSIASFEFETSKTKWEHLDINMSWKTIQIESYYVAVSLRACVYVVFLYVFFFFFFLMIQLTFCFLQENFHCRKFEIEKKIYQQQHHHHHHHYRWRCDWRIHCKIKICYANTVFMSIRISIPTHHFCLLKSKCIQLQIHSSQVDTCAKVKSLEYRISSSFSFISIQKIKKLINKRSVCMASAEHLIDAGRSRFHI